MSTYKHSDTTGQSLHALADFVQSRGPGETVRDAVEEILRTFQRAEDVTVSSETYNGWSNRETWALGLHLGNDQGLYNETNERLAAAYREADTPTWADDAETLHRHRVGQAADALKDWVTDELLSAAYWRDELGGPMPEGLESMRDDCGSLWRVDWYKIAGNWLGDMDPAALADDDSDDDED